MLAAISMSIFAGFTLAPGEAYANITYTIVDYPSLEDGFMVSGTIATNGAIGTALPSSDIISFSITTTITNAAGFRTIDTLTSSNSAIGGLFDATATTLTVAASTDGLEIYGIGGDYLKWTNTGSTIKPANTYTEGTSEGALWSFSWPATDPVATTPQTLTVPEPSSGAVAIFGLAVGIAYARDRRRPAGHRRV